MMEAITEEMENMSSEIQQLRAELERERRLRKKAECELKLSREDGREKDEMLKECEDRILLLEPQWEEAMFMLSSEEPMSNEEEVSVAVVEQIEEGFGAGEGVLPEIGEPVIDTGSGIASYGDWAWLPTIPEEDPESVPGYYDECMRYAESLKFSIGSDQIQAVAEIPVQNEVEIAVEIENANEVVIEEQEHDAVAKIEPVKRRQRKHKYKVLYTAAWF